MIRQTRLDDAHAIADIYNHYIKNTRVTFEETLVTVSDINARILELESTGLPRVVAEHNGNVIGYAYATKWSGRCSYRYSVEITIYLDASVSKRGWGTQLYKVLFDELYCCFYLIKHIGIIINVINDRNIVFKTAYLKRGYGRFI